MLDTWIAEIWIFKPRCGCPFEYKGRLFLLNIYRGACNVELIKGRLYNKGKLIFMDVNLKRDIWYFYMKNDYCLCSLSKFSVTAMCYFVPTFIFHLLHVLGAKRSGFESHSGHQFLNYLNCFGIFLVLEIYFKNNVFSVRLWNCSYILNFWQNMVNTDSGNPETFHGKLCLLQLKVSFREIITTNLNEIWTTEICNLRHFRILNLQILFHFLW